MLANVPQFRASWRSEKDIIAHHPGERSALFLCLRWSGSQKGQARVWAVWGMGPWAAWGKFATSHMGKQVGPVWSANGTKKGPELRLCLRDGNREPLMVPGCPPSTHEAGGTQRCCPNIPWVDKVPHLPSPQVPHCLALACPGKSGAVLGLVGNLGPGKP